MFSISDWYLKRDSFFLVLLDSGFCILLRLFIDDVELLMLTALDFDKICEVFILLDTSSPFFGFKVIFFFPLASFTVELTERTEMLLQEKVLGLRVFDSKFVSKSNKLYSSSYC